MPQEIVGYLYVNKKTGERSAAPKPWKRDGTEKWPRSWVEIKLVPAEGEPVIPNQQDWNNVEV